MTEWAIADGYHKVHACCQYSHSTVEAIIDLHGRLGDADAARAVASRSKHIRSA